MAASTSTMPFDATSWNLGISAHAIEILNQNFQHMLQFVDPNWENDQEHFPLWQPGLTSDSDDSDAPDDGLVGISAETLDFLRGLEIPLHNKRPSLLLHELGSYANDPVMKKRIREVFKQADVNCFVNSSGTGKTRHLLEALCIEWGFYFCIRDKSEDIGSFDMKSLESRIQSKANFTAKLPGDGAADFHSKLKQNREFARDSVSHVVLARLLVFRMFLEAIVASGRSITPADKRRWALLQVDPSFLGARDLPNGDIFEYLAETLDAPTPILRTQRSSLRFNSTFQDIAKTVLQKDCSRLILQHYRDPAKKHSGESKQPVFYFVLDEAQLASTLMRSAFRADTMTDGKLEPRSLLREILVVFFFMVLRFNGVIITGTGLDLSMMKESAQSVVYKTSLRKGLFTTDTGGFYESGGALHAQYIRRYLPPHLLSTEEGQWLVKRMTTWLVGRYRTTAAMLVHLLETGFQNPHDEMNRWIMYNARVIPSDHAAVTLPDITASNDRVDDIGTLISQLHFYKIDRNVKMRDSFVRAVFESFLRSSVTSNIYGEARLWVECGFARFTDSKLKECRIFEPLIVLAAMSQMERAAAMRYSDGDPDLAESIQPGQLLMQYIESKTSEKDNKNNGYENYVALLLAQALGELTPLDEVFQFHDLPGHRPAWSKKRGRLVVLHREDGPQSTPSCYEVNWSKSRLPSGNLGHTCTTVEETLAWLDHRDPLRAAICFPCEHMGPDILLKLKLEDGSYAWVAVQCKNHGDGATTKAGVPKSSGEKIATAIRTVEPGQFWLDKTGTQWSPTKHPRLQDTTADALAAFNPKSLANDIMAADISKHKFRLIRAVSFFPIDMKLQFLEDDELKDAGKHPICTLNWAFLEKYDVRGFFKNWSASYREAHGDADTDTDTGAAPSRKQGTRKGLRSDTAALSSALNGSQSSPAPSSRAASTSARRVKRKTPAKRQKSSKRQKRDDSSSGDESMPAASRARSRSSDSSLTPLPSDSEDAADRDVSMASARGESTMDVD